MYALRASDRDVLGRIPLLPNSYGLDVAFVPRKGNARSSFFFHVALYIYSPVRAIGVSEFSGRPAYPPVLPTRVWCLRFMLYGRSRCRWSSVQTTAVRVYNIVRWPFEIHHVRRARITTQEG